MVKLKTFNYRDKILDYGFLELDRSSSGTSLGTIISAVKESLFIVDTKGHVLLSILKKMESYLNQNEKILVGLTNEKTLSELKKNGVNNGLFRSTDEQFYVALIIKDKTAVYLAFDVESIVEIPNKYADEIFKFVNHVFWSNTNFEQLQGSLKKVDNARLSVVMPSFLNDFNLKAKSYTYASEGEDANANCIILKKERDIHKKAIVIPYDIDALSLNKNDLHIHVFRNQYYNVLFHSLISAESFENIKIADLQGKNVWFNGKVMPVSLSESMEEIVDVPLDEVDLFEPDYSRYESKFNGLTLELNIKVNVNPMTVDNSYSLSKRYASIHKVEAQLENAFEKLRKLNLDKKMLKQIESIKTERLLMNKVKMFNKFISSKEFGVEALNNKKSPISSICVNEEELLVPNELIGKLYTKQGKDYLATTKERISDAKAWLNENKVEAILIKA